MTDDDWAPLPADQRGLHPGELAELGKREPKPAAPPAAPPPAQRDIAAQPADEAAAERALAELKQRLAQTSPARSLIAEVQHRQQQQERKQRGVRAAAVRAMARHTAAVAAKEPAAADVREARSGPTVEIDTEVADIDPRETEPWFAELPKKEQERLRTHWWYERHRHDDAGVRLRRRLGRAVGYGALMFFVMGLLLVTIMGSFAIVPMLTAAGAIAAGAAELCGGGRFLYGIAGAIAFVAVFGATALVQPLSMMALLLLTYGMATLGMDGEMRKSGGFGDR